MRYFLILLSLSFVAGCGAPVDSGASNSAPAGTPKSTTKTKPAKKASSGPKTASPTKVESVAETLLKDQLKDYGEDLDEYNKASTAKRKAEGELAELEAERDKIDAKMPQMPKLDERSWFAKKSTSSTKGVMVGVSSDKKKVHIKKENGKTVKVPIAKLVEYNQSYIKKHQKKFIEYQTAMVPWEKELREITDKIHKKNDQLRSLNVPTKPVKPTLASVKLAIKKEEEAKEKAEEEARAKRYKRSLDQVGDLLADEFKSGMILRLAGEGETLVVTVSNLWLLKLKQVKKQDVQNLIAIWKGNLSGPYKKKAKISIRDQNGNELATFDPFWGVTVKDLD